MPAYFADRLNMAIKEKKTPVCVGIDPVYSRLPSAIRDMPGLGDGRDTESALDAILEFCRTVIKTVAPIVPAVKINIAYFERYYGEGVDAYMELVQEAAKLGLLVIGDCKRGDVGHTADLYARAQLARPDFDNMSHSTAPDAVTLHSFLGLDGLKPFLDVCREEGKGVFALIQTSNESADDVQGFTNAQGVTLSEHLAQLLDGWAGDDGLVGESGYSCLGAVVAPRNVETAKKLRMLMPKSLFLVPGYGAQGMSAADIAHCFKPDGTGAIVNASRSVIYAFDQAQYKQQGERNWTQAVETACRKFAQDIAQAVGF
ncbi:MAG: orotidine-5'-phosphate decarboxylase [Planctomycetes bacterium]|nr:orotidine-5'-phosphate decarboxylase [Planctomycetota bacterium]